MDGVKEGPNLMRNPSSTYSTGNRSEGGHSLNVIGIATSEGITLGVLSPLQDKLLSLVGGMLIAHPAGDKQEKKRQGWGLRFGKYHFFISSLSQKSEPSALTN